MAKAKIRKVDTWKTKEWYGIHAPKMFNEMEIGETFASDPRSLRGRVVEITFRDIANDFSKQHIKLRFQIDGVEGKVVNTKFMGYSLSREYMRSQIRRKTTRIEGVVDITTKDGYKLRVKNIALAVGRAQTAQEKLVRKFMSEVISKSASREVLDQFIQSVVVGKVPSMMYRAVNKIYPVKRVEVRKIKVLEEPKIQVKKETPTKKKAKTTSKNP